MKTDELRAGLRVVAPYVVVAGAWILFSDTVLLWVTADAAVVNTLQSLKGLLFVGVTALLLWALLTRELRLRRQTETALDDSQRFAAQLAAAAPGWLYVLDLAERRTRFANRGLTAVLGYPAEQLAALGAEPLQTLTHPADWHAYSEQVIPRFADLPDGQALEVTTRLRHASGEWRWLRGHELVFQRDAAGRPTQVLGMAVDITEQKQTEAALQASERRYRVLTDASPVGVFQTDAAGACVYVNQRWCEITGLTPAQALGAGWASAVHPEDRSLLVTRWSTVAANGPQAPGREYRLLRPDGAVVWVSGQVAPERTEQGVAGYVGTLTDITRLKEAEARIRRLNRVYAMLSDVNQTIVRVRERQPLFEAACRIAVERGGFTLAWIGLADLTGRLAVTASAGAAAHRPYLERALTAAPHGPEPAAEALRAGRSVVCNDLAPVEREAVWRADTEALGYRAAAAFPLVVAGHVRGTFTLYANEPGFFDADELHLLNELTLDLAYALEFIERETQHRQAEAALRQSEARFRTFFENAPAYCYMVSPDGVLLDVNAEILQALGYTREELVGAPLATLYAPGSQARAHTVFQRWLETGEVRNEELRVRTKAGAERVVLLSAQAVRDEAGRLLHSISLQRDITERVQAEAALRQSEARYRQLVEQAPLGIAIHQAGQVVFANSACAAITGAASAAELLGRPVRAFVHPDEWEETQARIGQLADGLTGAVKNRYLRLDGGVVDVEVTAAAVTFDGAPAVQVLVQDVTARNAAEAARRASEARYRRLVENAPAIVYQFAPARGGVYYSPQTTAIIGFTPAELTAQPMLWHDVIHPEDVAQVDAAVAGFAHGQGFDLEYRLRGRHGRWVWLQDRSIGRLDGDNDLVIEGLALDITERKQAEEARRLALERLRNLHQIDRDLIQATSQTVMLATTLARLRELTGSQRASVALFDYAAGEIELLAVQTDGPTALPAGRRQLLDPARLTHFGAGQPVLVPDLTAVADLSTLQRQLLDDGLRAYMQIPLIVRGELIGALNLAAHQPHAFAMEHVEIATEVGGQVAIVISNTRLLETTLRQSAALRASEARYRALVESMDDVVFTLDAAGRHSGVFGRWVERAGLTPEVFLGRTAAEVLGPEAGAAHAAANQRVLAGERVTYDWSVDGPAGKTYTQTVLSPIYDDQGKVAGAVGVGRDITARKQAEAVLQTQLTMLNALYTQAHQLAESLDPHAVALSVTRQCVETFGLRLAWLGEAEPDGHVEVVAHYPVELDYPRQLRVRWDESPEGYGPTGRAIRSRAPVLSTEAGRPAREPWRTLTQQSGFQASAAFPLINRERAVGSLNLYSDQADFFAPERIALFQALAHQAAAALTNARLFQSVAEQREQVRGLAARLSEADEAERRSLARELHDRVGANLTALNLSLTLVRNQLPPAEQARIGARLEDATQLLQETIVQVRTVMMELRPSVLDDYGLLATLRWYGDQLSQRTGLTVQILGAEPEPRLAPAAETALFRVAQEALTNVVKHAQVRQAEVRLEAEGRLIRLRITDAGAGFDPNGMTTHSGAGGWGMINIRERVAALGGRLRVETAPGQGTRLTVELER